MTIQFSIDLCVVAAAAADGLVLPPIMKHQRAAAADSNEASRRLRPLAANVINFILYFINASNCEINKHKSVTRYFLW